MITHKCILVCLLKLIFIYGKISLINACPFVGIDCTSSDSEQFISKTIITTWNTWEAMDLVKDHGKLETTLLCAAVANIRGHVGLVHFEGM